MGQTVLFDLEKHGRNELEGALNRLPAGSTIILNGSGLRITVNATRSHVYQIGVPPRVTKRPPVDPIALRSRSTVTDEVIHAHNWILGEEG